MADGEVRRGYLKAYASVLEAQRGLEDYFLFSVNYFCRRVASLRNVTEILALGVRSNQR